MGSTSQLIKAAQTLPNKKLIVATDTGIFYKMQQACPDKEFMAAPTAGNGATCRSCAHCPWMAMNGLHSIENALVNAPAVNTSASVASLEAVKPSHHEIVVDEDLRLAALKPLDRMLNFAQNLNMKVKGNA